MCTGTSSSTHNLLSLVPVSCVLKLGKETDHQTCNSTLREEGGEGGGGSGKEGEERRGKEGGAVVNSRTQSNTMYLQYHIWKSKYTTVGGV